MANPIVNKAFQNYKNECEELEQLNQDFADEQQKVLSAMSKMNSAWKKVEKAVIKGEKGTKKTVEQFDNAVSKAHDKITKLVAKIMAQKKSVRAARENYFKLAEKFGLA